MRASGRRRSSRWLVSVLVASVRANSSPTAAGCLPGRLPRAGAVACGARCGPGSGVASDVEVQPARRGGMAGARVLRCPAFDQVASRSPAHRTVDVGQGRPKRAQRTLPPGPRHPDLARGLPQDRCIAAFTCSLTGLAASASMSTSRVKQPATGIGGHSDADRLNLRWSGPEAAAGAERVLAFLITHQESLRATSGTFANSRAGHRSTRAPAFAAPSREFDSANSGHASKPRANCLSARPRPLRAWATVHRAPRARRSDPCTLGEALRSRHPGETARLRVSA
jgi:hypothetical protein